MVSKIYKNLKTLDIWAFKNHLFALLIMKWKHDKLNLLCFLSVLLLCGCSLLKFIGGLTLNIFWKLQPHWSSVEKDIPYMLSEFIWKDCFNYKYDILKSQRHAWFPSCTSWVFPVFSNAISTSFINYWHVSIYVFKAFKEAEIPDIEGKWPRLALKYTWTWTVCVLSRKKAIACMYVWWLTPNMIIAMCWCYCLIMVKTCFHVSESFWKEA